MVRINKLIALAQSYLDKTDILYSIEEKSDNKTLKIKAISDGFKLSVTEKKQSQDSSINTICIISVSLGEGINIFYDSSEKTNYREEQDKPVWDQLDITTISKYSKGNNQKEIDVITNRQVKRTINTNSKNEESKIKNRNTEQTINVDTHFNFLNGFNDVPKTYGTKK